MMALTLIFSTETAVGYLLSTRSVCTNMRPALASSASPLCEGERIEVRGKQLCSVAISETLTLPSPLGRERRRRANVCNAFDSF